MFISGIESALGEPRDLANAASAEAEQPVIARLQAEGFSQFLCSSLTCAQLARRAVADTLAARRLSPEMVDAIVLSTESFWDDAGVTERHGKPAGLTTRADFVRSFFALGLTSAQLYGNWGAACSNFITALSISKGLLESGQADVLVNVLTDRLPPGCSRISDYGRTIFSDAAVAFEVAATGEFEVEHLLTQTASGVFHARTAGNMLRLTRELLGSLQTVSRRVEARTGRAWATYDHILSDNFHDSMRNMICAAIDVPTARLLNPVKAANAHTFATDCPLGLQALLRAGAIKAGDRIAILNCGPAFIGFAGLRYAGSAR